MKTILFVGTVLRATPEERAARRPLGRDPEAWGTMVQEELQIAKWADELGIDGFGMTEHHFQTEGGETNPNSLLLYSRLAAETERLRFWPLSMVLPARDPIRTAEDVAIFDNLYPGRLGGVGFARGYQTRWMQVLAQSEKVGATPMDKESDTNNHERFDEYLEVVRKAWTEDAWNHDGKYYKVPFPASGMPNWAAASWTRKYGAPGEVDDQDTLHKIGVVPKPRSIPQLFIPNTSSMSTVEKCARESIVALILRGNQDAFRAAAELYRDTARDAGRDIGLGEGIGATKTIVLGDSYEEAFEIAVRGCGYWYNNFFALFGITNTWRVPEDGPNWRLQFAEDRELVQRMVDLGDIIIGTPEMVCERLEEVTSCYSDGNLDWMVWELWFQGLPGDEQSDIAKRQLELYAKHVIPAFA